ncbi:PREDICTED: uncharacterized protein LOC109383454 [Hipposideros armiger]|uniref:Uncharacterized protein LOC109383454 n=1 Tax=Hipposideros armiger TaxID=186990 RepID=A0A8B7REH7_HIPAR|nr:PREDICTED: uncharacterized protein LOC109383454 [Hipposideros armiger]
MCPATVDLAGDLTQSTAVWFPLQTHLPQSVFRTTPETRGGSKRIGRIKSQPSFGLCLWQMHSCCLSNPKGPAPSVPCCSVAALGGDEGVRRAWVGGRQAAQRAHGGGGAVSLSALEGPGREGGERVSMAPRLRGLRGRRARSVPVAPGRAGARILAVTAPRGLAGQLLQRSRQRVIPSGVELLRRPPPGDAPRQSRKPRTPTSARRAQLLRRARTFGAGEARGAQPGWWLEQLCLAEMTSRLWLWCFCAWVAASWPPGSALQLRPDMPNVCEEQQLAVVGLAHPCVRAFTRTIKLWKQGCAGPRGCVGYERRTQYYTIYRQMYSMERQTIFRCCPGWSQQDHEPGCPRSVSAVETCFNGRRCSDSEAQRCQCSEGFQGPHCQYEVNENLD